MAAHGCDLDTAFKFLSSQSAGAASQSCWMIWRSGQPGIVDKSSSKVTRATEAASSTEQRRCGDRDASPLTIDDLEIMPGTCQAWLVKPSNGSWPPRVGPTG